jgi:hypothetical protein
VGAGALGVPAISAIALLAVALGAGTGVHIPNLFFMSDASIGGARISISNYEKNQIRK